MRLSTLIWSYALCLIAVSTNSSFAQSRVVYRADVPVVSTFNGGVFNTSSVVSVVNTASRSCNYTVTFRNRAGTPFCSHTVRLIANQSFTACTRAIAGGFQMDQPCTHVCRFPRYGFGSAVVQSEATTPSVPCTAAVDAQIVELDRGSLVASDSVHVSQGLRAP
jgi:hypothetical protein